MLLRLLLHAEPAVRERLRALSEVDEVYVDEEGGAAATALAGEAGHDLILVHAPDAQTGLRALEKTPEGIEGPAVVIVAATTDIEDQAQLLAAGAYAVVHEGLPDEELRGALHALFERRRDEGLALLEAEQSQDEPGPDVFISKSAATKRLLAMVERVAAAGSPVLILGETGVGKERVANLVHSKSARAEGPFVALNCAAIPADLVESELFGHEKGSFTGASKARRGYFELAHQGTLFLDEVGEIPVSLQAKLLRVLQDKQVRPIGAANTVPVDVRVIAATNRDLETEIAAKRFRSDLYYRLSVVELEIPPLRERPEDVEALLAANLKHFRAILGRELRGYTPDARAALMAYDWPGNVRELMNVVERAVLLCLDERIGLADLPRTIVARIRAEGEGESPTPDAGELVEVDVSPEASGPPALELPEAWLGQPWKVVREELLLAGERAYLENVLRASGGRVGIAAKRAGLAERSLFEKMKRHGLKKEHFRGE